jgi:hypothetical protein
MQCFLFCSYGIPTRGFGGIAGVIPELISKLISNLISNLMPLCSMVAAAQFPSYRYSVSFDGKTLHQGAVSEAYNEKTPFMKGSWS